jgi:hypothetical protein
LFWQVVQSRTPGQRPPQHGPFGHASGWIQLPSPSQHNPACQQPTVRLFWQVEQGSVPGQMPPQHASPFGHCCTQAPFSPQHMPSWPQEVQTPLVHRLQEGQGRDGPQD